MNIINGQFPSIEQVTNQYFQTVDRKEGVKNNQSFADVFKQRQMIEADSGTLKFSKHASSRLSDRQIELSDSQISRLNAWTTKAMKKRHLRRCNSF